MDQDELFAPRTMQMVGRFIAAVVLGLGLGTLIVLFALLVKAVF